ncbi:MAG TPA: ATP-binding protein [Actinomycetales bacterium]|nr:ATP-binding protein [Actinomycetales bacterium]
MDVDDLPDGLVVADADARVVEFNAAAERVTGLDRDSVLGQDIRTVLPLQDSSGRRWWQCTDPWAGLAIRTGHRERLLVLPPARELLVTARYIRPGRSEPIERVVLLLRDTESRRRAEHDHAGLISTVAHELRSPLTSVKGFTATLLRRWEKFTDEQKRLMLSTVEADADRVTRLIAELLDISRIEAGRLEVRRQVVDLPDLVEGQVRRLGASGHDESRFDLRLDRDGLPELWADPDRLEQVLANLLENALRHGEGQVRVTVAPADVNGVGPGVLLRVEDAGEGIPEEQFGMVFTKFWRGGRRGGTGLGLYVVRGLVEAHGGRASIGRSTLGGAEFTVQLPSAAPTEP